MLRQSIPPPLWRRLREAPRVADRGRAEWRIADLDLSVHADLSALVASPKVHALLAAVADHSPFLWHLVEADTDRLHRVLRDDPKSRLDAIIATLGVIADDESEAGLMQRLRLARQEIALLVALADLGGAWTLDDVMLGLSRAADALIAAALTFLLRQADAAGALRLPDPTSPQTGCGLVVLGLGKLGGFELNYSSDVDLIVIFDPQSPAVVDIEKAKILFVRIVRDLVRLIQHPTVDGHVARVDLRLRPDPGSTAVAIGLRAAFLYYEAYGQNWERAAMIKARPVAGDTALGQAFLTGLSPFMWRRYFDYAAIADIHAMKRQIHAVKGGGEIAVAGHNVKLGRGGIREIEFFVQTQQLIFGGKRPALRGASTLPMLRQLHLEGWIGADAVADLSEAYAFLRRVEHRLQMVADEQTHIVPRTPAGLERFARFCGFASAERFSVTFTRHMQQVVAHYRLLFEHEPALDERGGSFVFTGVADDPETLETLARLGYRTPEDIAGTVRAWHSGQRPAVRSPRARETLTDLVPKLLVTFGRTSDPDAAIGAFDRALERMPAAAELFAILAANEALRTLFGDILGSAPVLADAVMARPHLLDAAIDPGAALSLDDNEMATRACQAVAHVETTEAVLDAIRDFHHEEHFLIGVRLLAGTLDPDDAGMAYSALAVGIIRAVLGRLRQTFEREHGVLSGGGLALVAMGKLGSREMTATSDLDLVLIYDFDAARATSDGLKPLDASAYFARLTQRLVSHLSVATRRGRLYEVDMRLRPSGRQGPLATKLSAFAAYQRSSAQSWEHMALTRARVIAGDAALVHRVDAEIVAVLRGVRDPDLKHDVVAMRALIEAEKPAKNAWDFKLVQGGLIDIEFIAQYLVLRHASAGAAILDPSTQAILRQAIAFGLIDAEDGSLLLGAHRLYSNVTQIMRLALPPDQEPERAGKGVKQRLAAAVGLPGFPQLKEEITLAHRAVRSVFEALMSKSPSEKLLSPMNRL